MSSNRHLSAAHLGLICASAISDEVRDARGYETVEDGYVLRNRHFGARQALVPALLIPLHPVQGDVVTYQIRPDKPRVNKKGDLVRYETPYRQPNRIDAHPLIQKHLGDPSVRLFITEGVRKADALVSKGECCIALTGVWNFLGTNAAGGKTVLSDFYDIAWNGRTVYIIFDSDAISKPDVQRATQQLKNVLKNRDADVHVIRLPAAPDGGKQGLDDYLAAGHSVDDLMKLVETDGQAQESAKPPPQATELVLLATKLFRFGRSLSNEPFAVRKDGPNVALMLRYGDDSLRAELAKLYVREHGRVPNQSALRDATLVLMGMCLEQPVEELALRMAHYNDSVIIDMGDDEGRAIEVTKDGWQVLPRSPVSFRRSELTNPMPLPIRGGSLNDLRQFLNVDDQSWPVLMGWLVAALLVGFSHPIVLVRGEQGSAKSTFVRLLMQLFDPSPAPLRAVPKSADDWAITASASWGIGLDNLSHIREWLSDALCRASTGDGWPKRTLWSNAGVSVYTFQRVIALTAIDAGSLRGDLADRTLFIDLDPIPKKRRKEEKVLLAEYDAARPRILGGLLDLTVMTLKALDSTRPSELPRMADFARVLASMDAATGTNAFQTYMAMIDRIAIEVTEGDEVAQALETFMTDQTEPWVGTAANLLVFLTPARPSEFWPKTPSHLSGRLARLAPNLRLIGLEVEPGKREGGTGARRVTIRKLRDGGVADASRDGQPESPSQKAASPSQKGGRRHRKQDHRDGGDGCDGENASLSGNRHLRKKGEKIGDKSENGRLPETIGKRPSSPSRRHTEIKSSAPIDPEGLRKVIGYPTPKSETP